MALHARGDPPPFPGGSGVRPRFPEAALPRACRRCLQGACWVDGGAWGFELGSHQPQNALVLFARCL